MNLRVVSIAERPDLASRCWDEVNRHGFAEFMVHDPVADEHFDALYDRFPELQFCLLDGDDRIHATGDAIPFSWDGTVDELPDEGWDWVLTQGMADAAAGRSPSMVSALQIVVSRDQTGTGLSHTALAAMREIVSRQGFRDLVAPVRPNGKHRYPLTPMARYVTWTRDDGALYDPWLRVHQRAGARVVKVAPRSMLIRGSLEQWEEWTGLVFPDSGEYIVAGALNPVAVDTTTGTATYVEPNVWMHHRLT